MKILRKFSALLLALTLCLSTVAVPSAQAATTYVGRIERTGQQYTKFCDLQADVRDGDTITLLSTTAISLRVTPTLSTASHGYKMSIGGGVAFCGNNGNIVNTLTIVDGTGTGSASLDFRTGGAITIGEGGTLTICGKNTANPLTLTCGLSGGLKTAGVYLNAGGSCSIESACFTGISNSNENTSSSVVIHNLGALTMTGVSVSNCSYNGKNLIYCGKNSTTAMDNCSFAVADTTTAVSFYNTAPAVLKDCTVSSTGSANALYVDKDGALQLEACTVNGGSGAYGVYLAKSGSSDHLSSYAHLSVDSETAISEVYLSSGCAIRLLDSDHMGSGRIGVTLQELRAVQVVDCSDIAVTAAQLAAHFAIDEFTQNEDLFWATEYPLIGRLVTPKDAALTEMQQALIATGYAYYYQGNSIRYDMYGNRRMVDMTPEEATDERNAYLDCSSYVDSVYYQTFLNSSGAHTHILHYSSQAKTYDEVNQPSTSNFKDYCRDHNSGEGADARADVAYYEYYAVSDKNAEFDLDALQAELQPGDLLNYRKSSGGGHVMLYLGDNTFLHCSGSSFEYLSYKSADDSVSVDSSDSSKLQLTDPVYCSDNDATFEAVYGAIQLLDASDLFSPDGCRYLNGTGSSRDITHVSLLRPLAISSNTKYVTAAAKARLAAPGLDIELSASVPYLNSVRPGELLAYTVTLKNHATETVSGITLSALAPEYTVMTDTVTDQQIDLDPGETKEYSFTVRVCDSAMGKTIVCGEGVTVQVGEGEIVCNTLKHTVIGKYAAYTNGVSGAAANTTTKSSHGWGSLLKVFDKLGITLPKSSKNATTENTINAINDVTDLTALSYRMDTALSKLLVPDLYGGVALSEGMIFDNDRIRQLRTDYLEPGDIIMVYNPILTDKKGVSNPDIYKAFAYLYIDESHIWGTNLPSTYNAASVAPSMLYSTEEEVNALFETILAYSRFAVLRPSLMAAHDISYEKQPSGTITVTSCTIQNDPLLYLADYTDSGRLLSVRSVTIGTAYALSGDHASLFLLDRASFTPLKAITDIKMMQ